LKKHGAARVLAVATHGVFSGNAIQRINDAPVDQIFVTDTIPASPAALASPKIEITPVSELFARAISRIHDGRSVSSLF
jgi:ribose-phosphate pyrophosphokinase